VQVFLVQVTGLYERCTAVFLYASYVLARSSYLVTYNKPRPLPGDFSTTATADATAFGRNDNGGGWLTIFYKGFRFVKAGVSTDSIVIQSENQTRVVGFDEAWESREPRASRAVSRPTACTASAL